MSNPVNGISSASLVNQINLQAKKDSLNTIKTQPDTEIKKPQLSADKKDTGSVNFGKIPADGGIKIGLKTDSPATITKNTIAGVLLGGGAGAAAEMGLRTLQKGKLQSPSLTGIGLGMTAGAGVALLTADVGDSKGAGLAQKSIGGALVGAGAGGTVQAVAKTLLAKGFKTSPAAGIALGASIGAGIGIANLDVGDSKTLRLTRNAVAGALIGTGAVGIGEAAVRTLLSTGIKTPTLAIVGIGAAAGAGIALAATKID